MLRYIEFEAPNRAVMNRASLPKPGPAEALVETVQSGISLGTERMWFDGSAPALRSGRRSYPYRPGYALVGRVVDVGGEFAELPADSRVFAMKPHGSHALLRRDDPFVALPESLHDDDAAAIALTATALHAAHRSSMTVGDAAIVAGLGALGFIMLQVLAASFAGPVIALTGSADKAALALRHGADAAVTYDALPGADLPPVQTVFECSGAASNVSRLLPLARRQGEIVLAGFYTEPVPLDGEALFERELTVKAVRSAGAASGDGDNEYNRWDRRRNLALAAEFVAQGKVKSGALVTHRFPAERFDEAYRLVADRPRSRSAIRVSLAWQ